MNQENKRPITIEDLLRLKRAERPGAEFWARFDRELRAKQLAALVKREPWWTHLPVGLGWLARYRVPVGAMAVMALTFVVVRQHRMEQPMTAPLASERPAPVVASSGILKIEPSILELNDAVILPPYDARELPATVAAVETPVVETAAPVRRSHQVSLLNDSVGAELIAAAQAAEALAARNVFSATQGFETRGMPERPTAVNPFQQMRDPTSERRIELVQATTAMLSSGNLPLRSSLRTTRNYSEEKMYEEQRGRWEGRPEGPTFRF